MGSILSLRLYSKNYKTRVKTICQIFSLASSLSTKSISVPKNYVRQLSRLLETSSRKYYKVLFPASPFFQTSITFHNRNQSFDFYWKSNNWFLYEIQNWAEMGYKIYGQVFCYSRKAFPAGIYLLKVNNRNTRARCQICSKLTIKPIPRSVVFIVNFEHI